MILSQINNAVVGLCQDISDSIVRKSWRNMSEREIVRELVLCILGGGVKYEIAVSYAKAIERSRCLSKKHSNNQELLEDSVSEILNNSVESYWGGKSFKRYRYPNVRAKYIAVSYTGIIKKYGSFKGLLEKQICVFDLRKVLVELCSGVGPKQASHFIKNVGYSDDLAIIDTHILKYMNIANYKLSNVSQLNDLNKYERIELLYKKSIRNFEYPVSVVDQAMWFVMRELSRERLA